MGILFFCIISSATSIYMNIKINQKILKYIDDNGYKLKLENNHGNNMGLIKYFIPGYNLIYVTLKAYKYTNNKESILNAFLIKGSIEKINKEETEEKRNDIYKIDINLNDEKGEISFYLDTSIEDFNIINIDGMNFISNVVITEVKGIASKMDKEDLEKEAIKWIIKDAKLDYQTEKKYTSSELKELKKELLEEIQELEEEEDNALRRKI